MQHIAFSSGGIYSSYTAYQIKELYRTEKSLHKVLNPIAKQFLDIKFVLEDKKTNEIIKNGHPLLEEIQRLSSNSPTFHYENIIDLYLTGNAFAVYMPTSKNWERIYSNCSVEYVDNIYTFTNNTENTKSKIEEAIITVPENEVLHFKQPSVFSDVFGDSAVAVALLNMMIDRYGYEFVTQFFIRGGMTTGIIETQEHVNEKLKRFLATLRTSFSGRQNMHTDKVLPKGAKWVGAGHKFTEIQLRELVRDNLRDFAGMLGVPPVLYGDTDGVNYANSETQMKLFYEQTILPLQKIYCSHILNDTKYSSLRDKYILKIDNTTIDYLSDYNKVVDQISSLRQVLTINEIRGKLGYDETDESYFQQQNIPTTGDLSFLEDSLKNMPYHKTKNDDDKKKS